MRRSNGGKKALCTLLPSSRQGFTLIEVMVVLAIIAAAVAIAIPRINNRNNQMKSMVRKFGMLSKELHSTAKLQGATYRLVIDMKLGLDDDRAHQYWVERADRVIFPSGKVPEPGQDSENEDEDSEAQNNQPFQLDGQVLDGVQDLPDGLRFSSVEVGSLDQALESGVAYIHFQPQGLVEEAVIHLQSGEDMKWTVAIHPLTGKAQILTREMSLKEIKEQ